MTTTPYSHVHADPDTAPRCSSSGGPGEHRTWTTTGVWVAGLLVAVAAAAATAHGLYEVVRAAGNPPVIAGLYPLLTDGLALVAYTATTRLTGRGRSYAWTIVVLAAGLSGLAQATYLAGGVHTTPVWLRAGVGGWPAIAAAIVAHLLYLLGSRQHSRPAQAGVRQPPVQIPSVQPGPEQATAEAALEYPDPEHLNAQPARVEHQASVEQASVQPTATGDRTTAVRPKQRAVTRARTHRHTHGVLPTVSELAHQAQVSRGTASAALKQLRTEKPALQIIHANNTDTPDLR